MISKYDLHTPTKQIVISFYNIQSNTTVHRSIYIKSILCMSSCSPKCSQVLPPRISTTKSPELFYFLFILIAKIIFLS